MENVEKDYWKSTERIFLLIRNNFGVIRGKKGKSHGIEMGRLVALQKQKWNKNQNKAFL